MKRTLGDICLLCQSKPANKPNSHILSKFLTKRIYAIKGVRIEFAPEGKSPAQDSPREDYLFCHDCEESLGQLEREVANDVFNRLEDTIFYDTFTASILTGQFADMLTLNHVDPKSYAAFVYSLFYRCFVCSAKLLTLKTTIDNTSLEIIRREIFTYIQTKDIPGNKFSFKFNTATAYGQNKNLALLASTSLSKNYVIIAGGVAFFLSTNEQETEPMYRNNGSDLIKISVITLDDWNNLLKINYHKNQHHYKIRIKDTRKKNKQASK